MNLEEQRQFILNGNMYNDLSDELVEAREKTVFLTNEYNASFGKPAGSYPEETVKIHRERCSF